MVKKQNLKVTVVCSSCGNYFDLDIKDWDRSRKPWCPPCTKELTVGTYKPRSEESAKAKRAQYKANRRWYRNTEDARAGIVRVIKDWKPIKEKKS